MWLVKAGTTIRVCAPFGRVGGASTTLSTDGKTSFTDTAPWKPYITKEDKLYDTEQVWDAVAVMNEREDVPFWAKHNIELSNYTDVVIQCQGKYALVKRADIVYLD